MCIAILHQGSHCNTCTALRLLAECASARFASFKNLGFEMWCAVESAFRSSRMQVHNVG